MTTTSPADPAGPAPTDGVHDPATVGDAGGGKPAGAAPAVASEAAAESPKTLVIPAEKQRWRKPLRNDIDPDVYAAFVYLRGLIAGDGRPHREIAVAMDIGPAEFAKRFSLSRQNFPPWSGIAPVFRVLDRDPGPFLARWGWLWEAPWSTDQLVYRGEPERFPALAAPEAAPPDIPAPRAETEIAPEAPPGAAPGSTPVTDPQPSDAPQEADQPAGATREDDKPAPSRKTDRGAGTAPDGDAAPDTTGGAGGVGETGGEDEEPPPAPALPADPDNTEDDAATGPIPGLPASELHEPDRDEPDRDATAKEVGRALEAAATATPPVAAAAREVPTALIPGRGAAASASPDRWHTDVGLRVGPRRHDPPAARPSRRNAESGPLSRVREQALQTVGEGAHRRLEPAAAVGSSAGWRQRTAAWLAEHAAAYLILGGIALALTGAGLGWAMMLFSAAGSSRPGPTAAPPAPAAQTWGTVHDSAPTGVTLRSAPALTGSEAGHAVDRTVLHVACGQTGDPVDDGLSPIRQHSSTWLRTDQNQYVSLLYLDMTPMTTISNCTPGQPELSLTPELSADDTATPDGSAESSSPSATSSAASSPSDTTSAADPPTTTTPPTTTDGNGGSYPSGF